MNRWEQIDELERAWLAAAHRARRRKRLALAALAVAVVLVVALSRGSL